MGFLVAAHEESYSGLGAASHHAIRLCRKSESHARVMSDVPIAQMHKAQAERNSQEQPDLQGKHDIILLEEVGLTKIEIKRKLILVHGIEEMKNNAQT